MRPAIISPKLKQPLSIAFILFCVLLLTSCSTYRSEVSWPKAEQEFNTFHTIPLYKVNKLILIQGEVDGTSGYFIFDTGAPGLVLNESYFKDYQTDPTRQVTGVNGHIYDARIRSVDNLKLGKLNFKYQQADVINLNHIEKKRKVKILGLLGINLFKGEELEIDLQKQVLRVFKTDRNGARLSCPKTAFQTKMISMPFRYTGELIELKASINNQPYNLVFDTGSEVLLLDKEIIGRDNIHTNIITTRKLLSTDGSSSGIEMRELDQIQVGLSLHKVTIITADLKKLRAFGLHVDGLIGYDLMASGIVTINFSTRILQIMPYTNS